MRLATFFAQHPNSDPLARNRLVNAGFILLFVGSLFSVVGLTWNRLVGHDTLANVIVLAVFFGILLGLPFQSWVWDRYISRSWVSAVPRQKDFFRSIGGVVGGLIVTELIYILFGLAIGWLVAPP